MNKEEGKSLDLGKIQQAAFSAIDELFSEDDEKKDPLIIKLEEKILALDWEFSDKELMELQETIQTLKESYTDKINKTLLTMMDNITKFLLFTREAAPPNTLIVLGQIASAFKEINFAPLTEEEKKLKLTEVYKYFKELKSKITETFKKPESIPKTVLEEKAKKVPTFEEVKPTEGLIVEEPGLKEEIAPSEITPIPSTPETTLEKRAPEVPAVKEIKPAKELKVEKPAMREEITPSEATPIPPESAPTVSEKPSEIISQLKDLQQKLLEIENTLSSQNSSLEDINTYLQSIEKQNFIILDNIKHFQEKIEPLLDLKKEIEFIKQEVVASKKEDTPRQEIPQTALPQEAGKTASTKTEETLGLKQIKETKETEESERTIKEEEEIEPLSFPYVQVFMLGSNYIALPFDCIANVYSISSKKIKKLLKKEKIRLKELKGFWRKLSKNMKGSLKKAKEKDLEKMEVPVLHLSLADKEKIQYNTAILVDCRKQYGVIFASKFLGNKTFLPEKGEKIQQDDIEARVFIPKVGEAYLLNPCILLNR